MFSQAVLPTGDGLSSAKEVAIYRRQAAYNFGVDGIPFPNAKIEIQDCECLQKL